MQQDSIESRGVAFIVDEALGEDWIYGDGIRIQQVLMNLISNAAKFTPAGGSITVSARQSRVGEDEVETVFKVADTGCGISRDFIEHIFESFSQERSKNSSSQKGTGLGLAICHSLIKLMNGDITVESEPGRGSCFTVTFTAKIAPAGSAPHEEKPARDTGRSVSVLFAEDNELNAEILGEILEENGYTAARAADGEEVVAMFERSAVGEYDVILMDVQMPKKDGCAAAAAIRLLPREDAKTIPIIACTANAFQEDIEKAYAAGMNGYLSKPIDIEAMIEAISRAVQDSQNG